MSAKAKHNWQPSELKRLETLRRAGNSLEEISRAMGIPSGLIRSRITALGLNGVKGRKHNSFNRMRKPPKFAHRQEGGLRADEPKPLGNDNGCQWLHGEPVNRDFCGHARKDGSVYCEHHHARCFDKVSTAESERRARLAMAQVAA